MLKQKQGTQLSLEADPSSRELAFSIRKKANIESVHSVSKDLLLIQSKQYEWTMQTVDGSIQKISSEL